MPTINEKRPPSSASAGVRPGPLERSKPLWALVIGALLFVGYLRRLDTLVAPALASALASASAISPLPEATHEAPEPVVKEIVTSDGRRFTSGPAFPPSAWDDLRKRERELPQHNLSLPFPEGRTGRYVRFTNQNRGLGWSKVLNEMLLNAEVAHQSNRGFVAEEYTWMSSFYPWQPAPWPTKTPMSALVSGPLAGGNWELGDNAPRTIAQWYWEEVCPQSERTIITSNDAKNPVRWHEGAEVFKHYVQLLKDTPGRCVEFTASYDDSFPQLFDLWLLGGLLAVERSVSMSELFLHTASSRLLGPSDVVTAAIARNMGKFLLPGPRSPKASQHPFERTMAVQIRRGNFGTACKSRALWASTYYQWNMFPTLPDKFVVPPGAGNGSATDAAKELYRHHCNPTDDEMLAAIRRARTEYTAAHPDRHLDVLYVLTNQDAAWVRAFAATMRKEGWGTVVGTPDLALDAEQTEVGIAVDMEIARRAEIFIGNGWSSFMSNIVHGRLVDKKPPLATRFW